MIKIYWIGSNSIPHSYLWGLDHQKSGGTVSVHYSWNGNISTWTHMHIYICNYSEYYDITPNKAPQNTEIHWAFDWVVWYMRGNGFWPLFLVHSSWFVLKLLTIHAIGGWISMKSVSGPPKIPNKNAQNIVFCPFLGAFTLKHIQMF